MKVSVKNKALINQLIKGIPKSVYEYYDNKPYELLVYSNENEFEVLQYVSFKNTTELDKVIDKIIEKYKDKLDNIDFKWSESNGAFEQFTIYKS